MLLKWCRRTKKCENEKSCFRWDHWVELLCHIQARFIYRLYRLKPRASRSKGASNKLWHA